MGFCSVFAIKRKDFLTLLVADWQDFLIWSGQGKLSELLPVVLGQSPLVSDGENDSAGALKVVLCSCSEESKGSTNFLGPGENFTFPSVKNGCDAGGRYELSQLNTEAGAVPLMQTARGGRVRARSSDH